MMKNYIVLLCCNLFVFCGNGTSSETKGTNTDAKDISETISSTEYVQETPISDALPVLNFDEFEAQYLEQDETETTYVINFWATWCKPCVKELPYFETLNAKYKEANVKVILVSLDFPQHIDKQVIPFIEKHQLMSEVLLLDDPDANSWIPKVNEEWSGAIPATILVKGTTKKFYEQAFTFSELEKEVQSIL